MAIDKISKLLAECAIPPQKVDKREEKASALTMRLKEIVNPLLSDAENLKEAHEQITRAVTNLEVASFKDEDTLNLFLRTSRAALKKYEDSEQSKADYATMQIELREAFSEPAKRLIAEMDKIIEHTTPHPLVDFWESIMKLKNAIHSSEESVESLIFALYQHQNPLIQALIDAAQKLNQTPLFQSKYGISLSLENLQEKKKEILDKQAEALETSTAFLNLITWHQELLEKKIMNKLFSAFWNLKAVGEKPASYYLGFSRTPGSGMYKLIDENEAILDEQKAGQKTRTHNSFLSGHSKDDETTYREAKKRAKVLKAFVEILNNENSALQELSKGIGNLVNLPNVNRVAAAVNEQNLSQIEKNIEKNLPHFGRTLLNRATRIHTDLMKDQKLLEEKIRGQILALNDNEVSLKKVDRLVSSDENFALKKQKIELEKLSEQMNASNNSIETLFGTWQKNYPLSPKGEEESLIFETERRQQEASELLGQAAKVSQKIELSRDWIAHVEENSCFHFLKLSIISANEKLLKKLKEDLPRLEEKSKNHLSETFNEVLVLQSKISYSNEIKETVEKNLELLREETKKMNE